MATWAFRWRDAAMLELRRREAAALFAGGMRSAEVARRLAVSRAAVHRWRARWSEGGEAALRARRRPGRPRRAGPNLGPLLDRLLRPPPGGGGTAGWSLERLATALRRRTGIRYPRSTLWAILRRNGYGWTGTLASPPTAPTGRASHRSRRLRPLDPRRRRPGPRSPARAR